jgi:hypothetical protein
MARRQTVSAAAGRQRKGNQAMKRIIARSAAGALLAAGAVTVAAPPAGAETLIENSAEFRFQLDFHVNDAALQKLLPAGWEPMIAPQGPAKDCNLRLIFIDRVDVTNPDNTPKATDQLVYVEIPVKQTGTGNAGRMVISGLVSDAKQAPGPFSSFVHAPTVKVSRTFNTVDGATVGEENWEFTGASGERLQTHVKYERSAARRNPPNEMKFFDPAKPESYQIVRFESGIDIMKNASVPVKDRVQEFSYKASGGPVGALFDGTEKVLSWDSFHWYNRGIYSP